MKLLLTPLQQVTNSAGEAVQLGLSLQVSALQYVQKQIRTKY
jgi:hypothetical protein